MIEPLDVSRCQAEVPNGASFMTLGGVPRLVRCTETPSIILVEREPGADGDHGAMTLCASCYAVFKKQAGTPRVHVYNIKRA